MPGRWYETVSELLSRPVAQPDRSTAGENKSKGARDSPNNNLNTSPKGGQRWRRTSSPPGRTVLDGHSDEALASYARTSLQIADRRNGSHAVSPAYASEYTDAHARRQTWQGSSQRDQYQELPYSNVAQQYIPFPAGPSYSPGRLPIAPSGPRRPLYTQEVPLDPRPYHTGGFSTPPYRAEAYETSSIPTAGYAATSPGWRRPPSPTRPPAIPPGLPSPSHLPSPYGPTPPRPYASSTPQRPSPFLTPNGPHASLSPTKPYSSPDIFACSSASPTTHLPSRSGWSASPAHAQAQEASSATQSPGAGKVKPGQCHGTTGQGKRCTRIVGKSKVKPARGTPVSASSTSSQTSTKLPSAGPAERTQLTFFALRQLDRRLSLGRGTKDRRDGNNVRHRALTTSPRREDPKGRSRQNSWHPCDEEDEDEPFEGGLARLTPLDDGGEDRSSEEELEELPVYCFQHAKQTLEQTATFVHDKRVDFDDWIPDYLPQETKLQLRHEISRPISKDDGPGYIYVHEMVGIDAGPSSTTLIKLGRSIRPVARLNQWKSQCRTRRPVVRDIFPLHPSHPQHPSITATALIAGSSPSRMHGALRIADHGAPNHHRWERLCLIELAGIAALQATARGRKSPDNTKKGEGSKCVDCGKIHVELFEVDKGAYEAHVMSLVLRWQKFIEEFA